MAYELIITERANELLDHILFYLVDRLKSKQAAGHLLDELEGVYDRLEENPLQFPLSRDTYLANMGYHEAVLVQMNYTLVFRLEMNPAVFQKACFVFKRKTFCPF